MRARVQSLADELLEGIARQDEMDLINDYARLAKQFWRPASFMTCGRSESVDR